MTEEVLMPNNAVPSFRKAWSLITALLFAFVTIFHTLKHGEAPPQFWWICGVVIVFYFGKKGFENIKIGMKSKED